MNGGVLLLDMEAEGIGGLVFVLETFSIPIESSPNRIYAYVVDAQFTLCNANSTEDLASRDCMEINSVLNN